ncbi:hypothetical protein BDQ17DRAFT_1325601 [Cyathus striatus]|nr:hypothetical protein BDQ17DRAFT_1325601 [Cyathus striatus]
MLQRKRPQAHLNYGFLKQLEVFEECRWRHKQNIGRFLGCIGDVAQVKLRSGREVFFTSNTDCAALLSLPDAARWIGEAVKKGGVVLVHCLAESRGVAAVCAAMMQMEGLDVEDAFGVVDQGRDGLVIVKSGWL